jgi:hypothetical protein
MEIASSREQGLMSGHTWLYPALSALDPSLHAAGLHSLLLAACLGPVATGPFDVAKTRLMAQSKMGGEMKYKVQG